MAKYETVECNECEGRGTLYFRVSDTRANSVPCHVCDGSGTVMEKVSPFDKCLEED
jgi:DnaJ-class molecular chaperone